MQDGQNLFVTLYRSWSHNAVATFTLCLLAQAYEQASALLQILCVPFRGFPLACRRKGGLTGERPYGARSADLEMTVPMLIQIDKLVQLIESPVFTLSLIHI